MVNENVRMSKISPAFLQYMIRAVYCADQMYKVELRICLKNHFLF